MKFFYSLIFIFNYLRSIAATSLKTNNNFFDQNCSAYKYNVLIIFCFLNYTKAFDRVHWNTLWLGP